MFERSTAMEPWSLTRFMERSGIYLHRHVTNLPIASEKVTKKSRHQLDKKLLSSGVHCFTAIHPFIKTAQKPCPKHLSAECFTE